MLNKKNIIFIIIILASLALFADQLHLQTGRSVAEFSEISGFGNNKASLQIFSGQNSANIRENITAEGSVIKVPETEYFINPCLPIIPQVNLQITLTGMVEVDDVKIISGLAAEGNTEGSILSHFQPVEWSLNSTKNIVKRSLDPEVYNFDKFFPGRWLDFTAGFDGKQTKVFIQLYPFQWNPITKEVIYLQEYSISVNGIEINLPKKNLSDSRTDAAHLILSPADWLTSAEELSDFHNSIGMTSEVINLAEIEADYVAAEDPTEPGYANTTSPVNDDYDYELAKKVISYLRENAEHPNLEYVTLLGCGLLLPPSYYFYNASSAGYSQWIPSDHYYASPDYDWVDNFSVCRIPVLDENALINYITKIQNVYSHFSENWVENITVSGGNAFEDDNFTGEMINNQAICYDIFDEMNIEKYQRFENRFSKTAFEPHMQNDDYLFNLHICHGSGDAIYFDQGPSISASELLNYPAKERLSIFLTVACMDGAFDTQLHNGGFTLSYSEGLISSEGAGIAYVGGSRNNGGVPAFYLDEGNVVFQGIDDMGALLFFFLESYRDCPAPTLGELTSKSKDLYLQNFSMNYSWIKSGFQRFVCHGSAGFPLPVSPNQNLQTTVPSISSFSGTGFTPVGYQISEIQYNEPLYFAISDNNTYDLQAVNITDLGSITTQEDIQNYFELEVPFGENVYLNKVINEEEKEAWHYNVISRNRLKHIDGDLEDWESDEIIASDPGGDISPGMFDLSLLYLAYDEVFDDFYFAFPEAFSDTYQADIYKVYYILAFDDETGGFSNNFENINDFPVNCFLGFENTEINKMLVVTLTSLNGEINSEVSFQCYDEINQQWNLQPVSESAVVDGGVEIRLPASYINYQNCQASFVSSIWELLPTQQNGIITDAVPTDPACPSSLLFGVENAVSVSEYFNFDIFTDADDLNLLTVTSLLQNYPNPFNPTTTISFDLSNETIETTELIVYNLKGQKVRELLNDQLSAGHHSVEWNGKDENDKQVSSGVYLYRLKSGKIEITRKMILLK